MRREKGRSYKNEQETKNKEVIGKRREEQRSGGREMTIMVNKEKRKQIGKHNPEKKRKEDERIIATREMRSEKRREKKTEDKSNKEKAKTEKGEQHNRKKNPRYGRRE